VATLASNARIEVPRQQLAEFCQRHHIRRLSLFGSVLGERFGPESDVDVLVEFEADKVPGLFRLAGLEMELSELLGGRKVDMNTPNCLSPYFRDKVVAEAEEQYVRP
jgi:predicted nucleotidyltransferase